MKNSEKYYILILSLILFLLEACAHPQEQYIKKWHGRTISFPEHMIFKKYAQKETDFEYQKSQYKVLVLLGGESCVSCRLHIDDWQRFICDMDSVGADIGYIFIMSPIYQRELYTVLKSYDFSLPVCIDNDKEFRDMNNISLNASHVFLLDKQNRVIIVGDPIVNIHIRNLYKSYLK